MSRSSGGSFSLLSNVYHGFVRRSMEGNVLMDIARLRSARKLLVASFLACSCYSCAQYKVRSPADYIGPKQSEPSTEVNAVAEAKTPTAGVPESVQPASAPEGPLKITVGQAILLSLENNRSLIVQRTNPQITRTFEQEQRAAFDPVLTGQAGYDRDKVDAGPATSTVSGPVGSIGAQEFLPTGTTLGVTGSTSPAAVAGLSEDERASRVAFNATQSLLRGFGPAVNLASLNQAKLDTEISQYELRGFAQTLVAQVEETYWDYALAERQIEIFTQSLALAQKQLEETQERIRVGDLAQTELSAAEAEVALRREGLINARSDLEKIKLNLLRLVNPPGSRLWDRQLVLASLPTSPSIPLDDVQSHVSLAMRMRPDLNQAKLLWQRGDLEVVKTRNGLLPRLDLFVTLGKTGYANSFGKSVSDIGGGSYDTFVGLDFEYPVLNRGAQARNLRAVLTRQQAREAISNLSQLVEVDVRTAYVEIARSQEQVAATAATRKLQEEKLRSETEKFRLGKSTSLLVAQAQRDLVSSQIAEVQAVVNYLQSFVEMYRQEGSLLERRSIASPGAEPVELPDTPSTQTNP
jgi:outer membrane protein TolC